jgi:hypothetical protein
VAVLLAATVVLVVATASPAEAATDVIVLPGANSAEGIAKGEGDTFDAGDLFRGDIFRGDLEDGTAELFIDAPDGRAAVGMQADLRHDLLFVAAEVSDVSVPAVDGIVVRGRELWAVQNSNQVTEVRLDEDLTSGTIDEVITDPAFHTATTAIRFDGGLAVVNAKFDTGFPPTADQYEVVLVDD